MVKFTEFIKKYDRLASSRKLQLSSDKIRIFNTSLKNSLKPALYI